MLVIPQDVRAELELAVASGYPVETCGVLIGSMESRRAVVRRMHQVTNLNTERAADRYELDPDGFRRADEQARAEGLEVVGIWHSHPDHPAQPSETDRRAAWKGWWYLIAAVTEAGVERLTVWYLDGEQFREDTLVLGHPVHSGDDG